MWLCKTSALSWRREFRARRLAYLPAFEVLEDRCLLSAGYVQTNLISDIPGLARYTDANLVNPWGLSVDDDGAWWIADNGTGVSPVNNGDGSASPPDEPLVVTVPGSDPSAVGRPTGTVAFEGDGFKISSGNTVGSSRFLFATQDGTISGWHWRVDLENALVVVDRSATPGHGPIYTGLAVASTAAGSFLYAANFRSGRIDVFDEDFQPVHKSGAFTDPDLSPGFVPFNVQELGGSVYVAYTKQDAGRYDTGSGQGNGVVDVFAPDGTFLRRVASGGPLAAPWGLVLAPSDFGTFSNALLVGNFADGQINAFDPDSGAFLGTMTDAAGEPIVLPGLWALDFGNGGEAGPTNVLYFTAGIGQEQHGLFGTLQPAAEAVAVGPSPSIADALASVPPNPLRAAASDDDYPLPPLQGPALRSDAAPPEPVAAFLPLDGSPLSVVPTLLLGGASGSSGYGTPIVNGSSAATPAAPLSTSGAGYVFSLPFHLSGTASPGTMPPRHIPIPETVTDVGSGGDSGLDGSDIVRPPAGAGATTPEPVGSAQMQSPDMSVPGAPPSALQAAEWDETVVLSEAKEASRAFSRSEGPVPDVALPAQEERRLALAMLPLSSHAHSSGMLWLQAAQDFVVLMLAWYGIRLSWSRRFLSSPVAVKKIRSLWSRSTRQPSKTALADPDDLPPRELLATRVIVIRPRNCEG